jgi:two-component SAPR family response regulator
MHRRSGLESQMEAQSNEDEQVLLHLKQAQAAAERLGDKATATLIEMLQRLCQSRSGISSEPIAAASTSSQKQTALASLNIHLFGSFQAFLNGTPINDWRKKSESLFKYLIVHRTVPVHREKLCELFWPDTEPQAARNCLNVTLHSLRQNLQLPAPTSGADSLVQFANDHYYLHPRLNVWTDTDAFTNYITLSQLALKGGNQTEALAYYEMAAVLYRGHFLENDCYEEWTIQPRERLKTAFLTLLAQQSQLYFASKNYTLQGESKVRKGRKNESSLVN